MKVLLNQTDVNGKSSLTSRHIGNSSSHWKHLWYWNRSWNTMVWQIMTVFQLSTCGKMFLTKEWRRRENYKLLTQTSEVSFITMVNGKFTLDITPEPQPIIVNKPGFAQYGSTHDGIPILVQVQIPTIVPPPKPDRLYNYCTNLCQWALHLIQHMIQPRKETLTDS